MFARTRPALLRVFTYSYRWISKDTSNFASISAKELSKFIESTNTDKDTLHLRWHEMSKDAKQLFQNALKENEAIPLKPVAKKKKKYNAARTETQTGAEEPQEQECVIEQIVVRSTEQMTNQDALAMMEWLNVIMVSPNNKIRGLNFDLREDANSNTHNADNTELAEQVIDSRCVAKLCEAICTNPSKFIELETLEFHAIALTAEDVQYLLDTIKYKCRYCEYLSLEACNLSDDILDIIYHFYYDNDYYALRNTCLSEIDLYGNRFSFSWTFHHHPLVALNRKIKKFLRLAIHSYGDFLRVENILIHTDDPYFWYCFFPNLRMTAGVVSMEYTSYMRDVVRFYRRTWQEETIRQMRKMVLITWFAMTTGLAVADIFRRGKRSWWFRVPEYFGFDLVKKRKRDSYRG